MAMGIGGKSTRPSCPSDVNVALLQLPPIAWCPRRPRTVTGSRSSVKITAPSANRSLIPTVVAVSLVLSTAKVNARSSSRIHIDSGGERRERNGTHGNLIEIECASEETFRAVAVRKGIGGSLPTHRFSRRIIRHCQRTS